MTGCVAVTATWSMAGVVTDSQALEIMADDVLDFVDACAHSIWDVAANTDGALMELELEFSLSWRSQDTFMLARSVALGAMQHAVASHPEVLRPTRLGLRLAEKVLSAPRFILQEDSEAESEPTVRLA